LLTNSLRAKHQREVEPVNEGNKVNEVISNVQNLLRELPLGAEDFGNFVACIKSPDILYMEKVFK